MTYGVNIYNLDERFNTICMVSHTRYYFKNGKVAITASMRDLVVLSESDGHCFLAKNNNGAIEIGCTNGTYADIMIFSTSLPNTTYGYGVNIKNKNNQLVFSSNLKFLRPVDIINPNNTKTYYIPTGRKYGVVLNVYGFNIHLQPTEVYQEHHAVKVNTSSISFGLGKYVLATYERTWLSARWNQDKIWFNAMIVDVTNY